MRNDITSGEDAGEVGDQWQQLWAQVTLQAKVVVEGKRTGLCPPSLSLWGKVTDCINLHGEEGRMSAPSEMAGGLGEISPIHQILHYSASPALMGRHHH